MVVELSLTIADLDERIEMPFKESGFILEMSAFGARREKAALSSPSACLARTLDPHRVRAIA
jgi:hypothetical protein